MAAGEVYGHTKASAEGIKDAGLTRKLVAAETKSGITTGARFDAEGQYVVSVFFYPDARFYIQKRLDDGSFTEAEPLEKERFDKTWALRL